MPRNPAPENETATDRFKRLALTRVPNATKAIGLIGNLSGKEYEYPKEWAETIISTVQKEVDDMAKALRKEAEAKTDGFTLEEVKPTEPAKA